MTSLPTTLDEIEYFNFACLGQKELNGIWVKKKDVQEMVIRRIITWESIKTSMYRSAVLNEYRRVFGITPEMIEDHKKRMKA